ncbi:MAG: ATP-dependent DNA helicase RecQ [Xenococcaceae cyanobacterium MO_167.B52]|nr:ATP-dependent DNA helicase RecQ [Xenococcaceae cyanobacterium MO_167.B52]
MFSVLQETWGYSDFRYPQKEIITSILSGKDTLVVMPTGGGKSLCFQLPALMQSGLTIVISPLVALMENQVQDLQHKKISAVLLHSQQSRRERKTNLKAIAQQQIKLLYLSPETLLSPPVWTVLTQPEIEINTLVLDEAHCLVQWGTTFRPDYTRLGAIRPTLLKSKPSGTKIAITAFTATADKITQQAIINSLQLKQPRKFILNPYRENIQLQVKTVWTPRGRRQEALKFIRNKGKQSGLIYVRSRKESSNLAVWLQSEGFVTAPYHGGLPSQQRRQIEQDWLSGKLPFVICTCAFGMGIDKADCRWVLHFHAPELLAEYIQEIGRSGRDGQAAVALTLVSEKTGFFNPEDKQRSQFFRNQLQQQLKQAQQIINYLPPKGEITTVIEEYPHGAIALALLYSIGAVSYVDPFHYQKQTSKISLARWSKIQQHWQKQMQQFFYTKQCRWQFLLAAFGFNDIAEEFSCGRCDQCQAR